MFLILNGRYYTTSNSSENCSNFVIFEDLKFPLNPGRTLIDEEQAYLKKNSKIIKDRGQEIEKQVSQGKGLEDLTKEVELLTDQIFFLDSIVKADNPNLQVNKYYYSINSGFDEKFQSSTLFLSKILNENVIVANGRIYPLVEINQDSYIHFDNKNYVFEASNKTVEDIEKLFNQEVEQELEAIARRNSTKFKELTEKIIELESQRKYLIKDLKIEQYPFCLEAGDLGYDMQTKCIYVLIRPHNNHTSGGSYGEGQSAATLSFANLVLANNALFAERPDRNSRFTISTRSHCFGDLKLYGTSLEDKMLYLREVANTIGTKGGFYQQTTSDDSSS